jgi:hypothetical protein
MSYEPNEKWDRLVVRCWLAILALGGVAWGVTAWAMQ